ncbi:hypothetical protein SEA_MARIETTA_63 [Gordonia phage Marietta]|uniref:Uncharacterized protein n=3 Tax=Sukkupivirus TaxID=2948917 RepID=A0A385DRR0_9CAUD|nr:hypothetical protein KNU07_gp63 [Gordonia phage Marietta]YP_010101277.1 hypothetical protein KNU47_gp61 [Gordonia phage IDyn]YP_010104642.1 hypothetical protein KNU78_gp63 [Gordonia phage Sukkupi]QAU06388.1 hypothetical protein SEA_WHOSEMANZ_62 [Gordonia phage WhoseManz]QAU07112.1 hypothetical protein SEA_BIPAUNETO_65 [Gordonia phage BiPauneto]QGH80779.1 hypothetical protein SEA_YNDEXA_63 [Gordonia phage Yndexa]AXQ61382.1 hypothetical protein SEA_MARIETTA_63 [Gordonia phage Marietta]QAY17
MIPRHQRCQPNHVQCSADHARLVSEYREERYRQEIEQENAGHWSREDHDRPAMITFKVWLIGSAGRNRVDFFDVNS